MLRRIAFLALACAALQGCVAAAIPIIAGGAVARKATDNNGDEAESRPVPAVTAPMPEEATSLPVEAPTPAPALSAVPKQTPQLEQFVRYATSKAFAFTQDREVLPTAVLIDPPALDGKRRSCAPGDERRPAILIDLDPAGSRFAEGATIPAPEAIALSLKVLRSEGVQIAWISENSAVDAYIIRDALKASGLDPDAEDTLLLMRYPDDRKQTRRSEFADETCLIAIAGDEKRDFDELFEYLVNPDAALALQPLMNNGWFLIDPVRHEPELNGEPEQ